MHVIAAKAVAFGEALQPGFVDYQRQVIANARALADELMKGGLDIVTGGTDTHLMLVDLRPKGVKGNATEKALGRAHITCNKNGIPFDTEKPTITSGVRLGTPAGTTRGFGEPEFRQIGRWIIEVVDGLAANGEEGNAAVEAKVKAEVEALCQRFPIYRGSDRRARGVGPDPAPRARALRGDMAEGPGAMPARPEASRNGTRSPLPTGRLGRNPHKRREPRVAGVPDAAGVKEAFPVPAPPVATPPFLRPGFPLRPNSLIKEFAKSFLKDFVPPLCSPLPAAPPPAIRGGRPELPEPATGLRPARAACPEAEPPRAALTPPRAAPPSARPSPRVPWRASPPPPRMVARLAVLAQLGLGDHPLRHDPQGDDRLQHPLHVIRRRIRHPPGPVAVQPPLVPRGQQAHRRPLRLRVMLKADPPRHMHHLVVPGRHMAVMLGLRRVEVRRDIGILPPEHRQHLVPRPRSAGACHWPARCARSARPADPAAAAGDWPPAPPPSGPRRRRGVLPR